jgi:hypothetical protein
VVVCCIFYVLCFMLYVVCCMYIYVCMYVGMYVSCITYSRKRGIPCPFAVELSISCMATGYSLACSSARLRCPDPTMAIFRPGGGGVGCRYTGG